MMICEEGLHCALCDADCPSYIEVKEVIYSHWVNSSIVGSKECHIPHCYYCGNIPAGGKKSKFCPNCGATMVEA